ncbi:hypothetical protein [Streptomyces sp. enrichment culture]|uniref:hypothetical protein n=1 Tax=Streptomyces sp. enrichment culture TaxID=1795815 RepID=UPI003F573220
MHFEQVARTGPVRHVERARELHAWHLGFTEAFVAACPNATDFPAARAYALKSVGELARRAQRAGGLRPDFVLDDLILMIMANRGTGAASTAARVATSRRFAALVLPAFRAPSEHALLPPVPRLAPASPG